MVDVQAWTLCVRWATDWREVRERHVVVVAYFSVDPPTMCVARLCTSPVIRRQDFRIFARMAVITLDTFQHSNGAGICSAVELFSNVLPCFPGCRSSHLDAANNIDECNWDGGE